MKKMILLSLALGLCGFISPTYAASPVQPKTGGIENPDYVWNAQRGEIAELLQIKGDIERGRSAYRVCQGCHKADAFGLANGIYPQLAGQHISVLVKQMADVREGRRDNPKMFPFAGKHIVETQEVANLAAFISSLPLPGNNGKGSGTDLPHGKALYDKDCASCHGAQGEGDAGKFYPVTAGQHYRYLLRQIEAIRDGSRRNANPEMVKSVKDYSSRDMNAVADYMSQITPPGKP